MKMVNQDYFYQGCWHRVLASCRLLYRRIPVLLFTVLACVALQNNAYAQHVLNGQVVDEQGAPLPGASVMILNSDNGTVAGVDGKFLLEVPSSSTTIQISYQGYFPL